MKHENNKRPVKCPPSTPACANCEPPKHPCPQGVIANYCTGAGVNPGRIFPPDIPVPEKPITMVCTTLDTTCLCKPIVQISFDCNVFIASPIIVPISLNFQLRKSCDNGQKVLCGIWTMKKDAFFGQWLNDSFEFAFCDCNPYPGCCTYSVELTFEVGADPRSVPSISINAPAIKAIAMESCGMATGTYGHQALKCQPKAHIYADCEAKHPCPQSVLFNCCTGAGLQTTNLCPATPLSLVCVTIDTTFLCRPLVILDFNAIIAASGFGGNVATLTFQVKKSYDNGQEIECGSWTFERVPAFPLATSDSFRFTFCDCNPCPGCCTYAVEMVSCTASDLNNRPFEGSFSINTPTAAVLAMDTCPQP